MNDSAFSSLTVESAYWIGFLAAGGGSVHRLRKSLCLYVQATNREDVRRFLKFLGVCNPEIAGQELSTGYGSEGRWISIHSRQIIYDVTHYNIVPGKSKMNIDYLATIPPELCSALIAGHFDYGGSIISNDADKYILSMATNFIMAHSIVNYLCIIHKISLQLPMLKGHVATVTWTDPKDIIKFGFIYLSMPQILLKTKNVSLFRSITGESPLGLKGS